MSAKKERKCKNCKVRQMVAASNEPACCKWFLDHVVILGESPDDCTDYAPIEETKEE